MKGRGPSGHRAAIAALIALVLDASAPAQEPPDLTSLTYITGHCERMRAAGTDLANCRGRLVQVAYSNGRSSFAFASDLGVVSFSGTDQRDEGGRRQLLVDRITIAARGVDEVPVVEAEGICEFDPRFDRPATISCAGRTEEGDFVGIFAADGSPPQVENFGGGD